jgi:hypothetical protein
MECQAPEDVFIHNQLTHLSRGVRRPVGTRRDRGFLQSRAEAEEVPATELPRPHGRLRCRALRRPNFVRLCSRIDVLDDLQEQALDGDDPAGPCLRDALNASVTSQLFAQYSKRHDIRLTMLRQQRDRQVSVRSCYRKSQLHFCL